ncbi:MAG: redoxin domain-containing protein [Caldilineaceae bacterium]
MLNTNVNHPSGVNSEFKSNLQSGLSSSPMLAQIGSLNALTPPVLRSNSATNSSSDTGSIVRRWLRRSSIAVLAVLTIAIVYLLLVNLVWTGLPAGTSAPQFTGTALDGSPIDLAQQRGQPVMLTFWSPDCFACREELPALQALANDANTNMQLITVVSRMDAQEVAQFAAAQGLTFSILVDPSGAIAQQYEVSGIPFTYFIDQNGQIDQAVIGAGPEGELQSNVFSWLQTCQIGEVCSAE